MIGCTYHDADLSVRQKLAFDDAQIRQALAEWQQRTSRHGTGDPLDLQSRGALCRWTRRSPPAAEQLIAALAGFHHLPAERSWPTSWSTLADQAVAAHLFRVAASLDSMVVGEPQILSQVKQAYPSGATESGTAGPQLHELFQAALRTGKRVDGRNLAPPASGEHPQRGDCGTRHLRVRNASTTSMCW